MFGDTLKLNSAYQPLDIITWQESMVLWKGEKAEVISTYEDRLLRTGTHFVEPEINKHKWFIHSEFDESLESWKTAFEMPAVIRLLDFVRPKKHIKFFESFTRENIWIRDNGICMYCGNPIAKNSFTMDHVIPRSRGGLTNWTNIVCSCLKCNSKKDNKTPEEANMKLIHRPFAPVIADDFNDGIIRRLKSIHKIYNNQKWRDYIYWQTELDHD